MSQEQETSNPPGDGTDIGVFDEPICTVCGNELAWVECHMIDCEDGSYDAYDEDPINCAPGDREVCGECGGRGGWYFCDHCNTERRPAPSAA